MVESGEADAALWLASAPPPAGRAPRRLWRWCPPGVTFATPPEVMIAVGEPGVDYDGVLHDPDLGTLAVRRAARPSAAPSAAEALRRITAALPC